QPKRALASVTIVHHAGPIGIFNSHFEQPIHTWKLNLCYVKHRSSQMLWAVRKQDCVPPRSQELEIQWAATDREAKAVYKIRPALAAVDPDNQWIALPLLITRRQQQRSLQGLAVQVPPLNQLRRTHLILLKLWVNISETPWLTEVPIDQPKVLVVLGIFRQIDQTPPVF